jgi:hypothetical protein
MCYSQLNKENLGNHRTIECNRSKRLLAKLSAIGSLFCFCYWSVSYVHYREPYFFQSPPLNGYSSVATLGCQQEREPTGQEPTKERYDTIRLLQSESSTVFHHNVLPNYRTVSSEPILAGFTEIPGDTNYQLRYTYTKEQLNHSKYGICSSERNLLYGENPVA